MFLEDPKTILIVEDHEPSRKLCRDLLELDGFEIIEATDGEEAVNLARIYRPDLVLMDIQLPLMNGLAATHILREKPETAQMPIVAFTAFAMKGDEERFLNEGFSGYIAKPIDTRRFSQTVRSFLSRSHEDE